MNPKLSKWKFLVALVSAVGLLGGLSAVPASASPVTSFETVYETDVAWAAIGGMKTTGTGTITLTGVTGTVTRALLYWHGPSSSTDPNVVASVTFDGASITGSSLGVSADNCWGRTNSWAWRADVTDLVSGNGDYELSGFIAASASVNGASLIVFYDDGDSSNNRDIAIFDGNDSNVGFAGPPEDLEGWDVNLDGINFSSGSVSLDLVVSDGQSFENAVDEPLVVNGITVAERGPIFEGLSTPNAGGGPGGQSLWDQLSFDVSNVLVVGENSLEITNAYNSGDCFAVVVVMVNLPAGSAPGSTRPPADPETPSTNNGEVVLDGPKVSPRFTG